MAKRKIFNCLNYHNRGYVLMSFKVRTMNNEALAYPLQSYKILAYNIYTIIIIMMAYGQSYYLVL